MAAEETSSDEGERLQQQDAVRKAHVLSLHAAGLEENASIDMNNHKLQMRKVLSRFTA